MMATRDPDLRDQIAELADGLEELAAQALLILDELENGPADDE